MASARRFSGGLFLSWLAACSAVSPDPATANAADLPRLVLSEQQAQACQQLEDAAVEAVVRRRYEDAEKAANRALAMNPRSARARAVLAMVKLQLANRHQPSDWYGQRAGEWQMELARQLDPQSAFVGWMHAVFLAEAGHMSAAAAAAEDALARTANAPASERAALLGTAGTYRYELGEERAARPHLEAYALLRPDDAAAHFRLGSCLLSIANTPQGSPPPYPRAQSEAEAAAVAFARCYELAPGDEDAALAVVTAWLRAAELAALQAKPEKQAERDALLAKSVAHLQQLVGQFPDNAEVHFRLGVLAARRRELDLAQAAYLAALQRDPEHVGSTLNLAALKVAAGDIDAARDLFTRLLAAKPVAAASANTELTVAERQRIERWLEAQDPAAATRGGE